MEKKYYHVSGILTKKGIRCSECGVMLDENLKHNKPCSIPTAATSVFKYYNFEISVWSCNAVLQVFKIEIINGHEIRQYYNIICKNKKIEEKLEELIYKSVDEQGFINQSGIYSLSSELEYFIEKEFGKGIFLKEEKIKNETNI